MSVAQTKEQINLFSPEFNAGIKAAENANKRRFENDIENITYVFSFPVVGYGAWNTPPKDIREAIVMSRFIQLMTAPDTFRDMATDTEAMWYLSTASMEFPLSSEWTRIYMWTFRKWRQEDKKSIPDFLDDVPEELDEYDRRYLLNRLKSDIRRTQLKHVKRFKPKPVKDNAEPPEPAMIQASLFGEVAA